MSRERISPGYLDVLTIVFVVLKASGLVQWSWTFVLAPLWIPILILLILALHERVVGS